MQIGIVDNLMLFEGVLNEETSLKILNESFLNLKKAGFSPPLGIDFSKTTYANSSGIMIWLNFVKSTAVQLKFVNAPSWLIGQFNMVKGFFENGSYVESLEAPFYSRETKDSITVVLKVGLDIPILSDYSNFRMPDRTIDGKTYEADFSPQSYFHFISQNFAVFQRQFK